MTKLSQAMNNASAALDSELEAALERECRVVQFTGPNHSADIERAADLHRDIVARRIRDKAERARELAKTLDGLDEKIARIEAQKRDAIEGARKADAADSRQIAGSTAWLEAVQTQLQAAE